MPLPTPQIQTFVCSLVGWLQSFAPFVLMLAVAAGLFMGLIARRGSLIADLIGSVIVALVLINLGQILSALSLNHC